MARTFYSRSPPMTCAKMFACVCGSYKSGRLCLIFFVASLRLNWISGSSFCFSSSPDYEFIFGV